MILKSMSRKEPSFGQLAAYMSDEKSDRAFDVHHNLFSRDPEAIAEEFDANAQYLGRRRGGNYLYHEILSIDTRACGQGRAVREQLRLLALEFIQKRCPRNMVYGALHRDHGEHLHYHLMISANERGERKRLRLAKAEFDQAKRGIELSARVNYPELQQAEIIAASPQEKQERRQIREGRKAHEMKKRGARLSKTEALAQELRAILVYATSQVELERMLKEKGFTFYERGKHCGVRPIPAEGATKARKAYRFATLGIDGEYAKFLERAERVIEEPSVDRSVEGEKEKAGNVENTLHSEGERADGNVKNEQNRSGSERQNSESHNEGYVNYDSSTDLNSEPASKQNPESGQAENSQKTAFRREVEDIYAKKREKKAQKEARKSERKPRSR